MPTTNGTRIRSGIEHITPLRAEQLLEGHENFRKLDKKRVDQYARDIEKGNWHLNGEAIVIDETGALLDGQHRLAACIKAGRGFESLVVSGVRSTRHVLLSTNTGKPRQTADYLTYLGYSRAASLAAMAGNVLAMRANVWGMGFKVANVREEIVSLVEANHDALHSALKMADRVRWSGPNVQPAVLASVLYYGVGERDPEDSETARFFANILAQGGGEKSEPAMLLRNRLMRSQKSHAERLPRVIARALYIIAWNKTVNGEPLRVLKWTGSGPSAQPFPLIIQTDD